MAPADDLEARLTADLHRLTGEHDVPGASVAVLVDGEVVESTTGVVNVRTGVDVTADTLFMIQSVTKIITATLVMQLVDTGLVRLDDPVVHHLPEFRTADRGISRRITVRHLLTHTGGFSGDLWAQTTSGPDALQRFVEDLVAVAPQRSAPGSRYSYCNAGYGVLGRLVEVQRGLRYEDALRQHLTEPLGIDELAFDADQALGFRTAIGHVRRGDDRALQPLRNWAVMPPSNPAAGNQLALSARGLLRIARLHLDPVSGHAGPPLLSAAATRQMRERQVDHRAAIGAPTSHGLGWRLDPGGVVGHGGDCPGVVATLTTVPEQGLAAVVLTNSDTGGQLIADLLEPLFADLAGVSVGRDLLTPDDQIVGDPEPYLGRFEERPYRREVSQDDAGRLWLTTIPQHESLDLAARAGTTPDSQTLQLRRVHDDTFVLVDADGATSGAVEFLDHDSRGQARALFVGGRVFPRAD